MCNKKELLPTFLYYLQKMMINGGENCKWLENRIS